MPAQSPVPQDITTQVPTLPLLLRVRLLMHFLHVTSIVQPSSRCCPTGSFVSEGRGRQIVYWFGLFLPGRGRGRRSLMRSLIKNQAKASRCTSPPGSSYCCYPPGQQVNKPRGGWMFQDQVDRRWRRRRQALLALADRSASPADIREPDRNRGHSRPKRGQIGRQASHGVRDRLGLRPRRRPEVRSRPAREPGRWRGPRGSPRCRPRGRRGPQWSIRLPPNQRRQ